MVELSFSVVPVALSYLYELQNFLDSRDVYLSCAFDDKLLIFAFIETKLFIANQELAFCKQVVNIFIVYEP